MVLMNTKKVFLEILEEKMTYMKIFLIIAFSFILVLPCYSELTQQDLDKISNLIDRKLEPIKQDIVSLKLDIAEMKGEIKAVKGEINGIKAQMITKEWILTMWITIFLAILAVPYLYGRSDRERVKEL